MATLVSTYAFITEALATEDCCVLGFFHLEVRDVELVVSGEVVGARSGHHQLVPGLLAGLLPGSRDQPEFCHDCWQEFCPPCR